jgi:hypothetical protein
MQQSVWLFLDLPQELKAASLLRNGAQVERADMSGREQKSSA